MFIDWERVRVFVRPGATDLRKQINGLAAITQTDMGQDALSGNLYLFSNADRRLLKALYWDRNGFCLWQKRLEPVTMLPFFIRLMSNMVFSVSSQRMSPL